uniref:Uncharacterized protein n=1 Tax=Peronospora matthiolae TaxID=2874970 RepID=A0AAV1TWI7_9STRA
MVVVALLGLNALTTDALTRLRVQVKPKPFVPAKLNEVCERPNQARRCAKGLSCEWDSAQVKICKKETSKPKSNKSVRYSDGADGNE